MVLSNLPPYPSAPKPRVLDLAPQPTVEYVRIVPASSGDGVPNTYWGSWSARRWLPWLYPVGTFIGCS